MDYSKYQLVQPGDFVMNHMDLLTGFVDIATECGVTSPDYRVFVSRAPTGIHKRYYLYAFQICYLQRIFYPLGQGSAQLGRWRLPRKAFEDFVLPVPTLTEQEQIARFLDYETARIDALIEKQRQLIALLQEKRQAVISHAVTEGLNPSAPMRDSGVEWLGKVPAHWQTMNLNRVVACFVDYRGRTPEKTDEGRPLVTAGAIRNGIVDLGRAPQFVSERTYHELRQRGVPEPGDLLFTSEAPLGEVAIVEDVAIACAQRIIMFKLNRRRIKPHYLWLYLRSNSGQDEVQTKASGSTAEGIRADRLRRCRVPVPPLDEQQDIVDHVAKHLSGFDDILEKVGRQMSLLQERRSALISAAVTGKIDVRNWHAPNTSDTENFTEPEAEVA